MMETFTPVTALLGGMLIGLAAAMLLLLGGRICGVSGIFGGMLHLKRGDTQWRIAFVGGLLAGGVLLQLFYAPATDFHLSYSAAAVALAGLLVGIGTRMGSGCTSGHGICGVSRLSPRSLVACLVFMASGAAAAVTVNHVFHGSI